MHYALTNVQTVAKYIFIIFILYYIYFIVSFYLFIFLAVVKFWLLHVVSRALINLRGSMVSPPQMVSPGVNGPPNPPSLRHWLEPEEAASISTEQLYSRYSGLFSR